MKKLRLSVVMVALLAVGILAGCSGPARIARRFRQYSQIARSSRLERRRRQSGSR
jgi:uncharacterized lipoprotein